MVGEYRGKRTSIISGYLLRELVGCIDLLHLPVGKGSDFGSSSSPLVLRELGVVDCQLGLQILNLIATHICFEFIEFETVGLVCILSTEFHGQQVVVSTLHDFQLLGSAIELRFQVVGGIERSATK